MSGVMKDNQVPGGTALRQVDQSLSNQLGGYRSAEVQKTGVATSVYGNYIEPVLHAAEHGRRATPIVNGTWSKNPAEFARAKDELKTVGSGGLLQNDNAYQSAAQNTKK